MTAGTISVGKPYVVGRANWPETAQYNYRRGEHRLELFFAEPSPAEIPAIRTGACEFALFVERPLIVLCFRFGAEWSDAPFSWHLVPAQERDLPSADIEEEKRALLQVVLVNATTGIVRAIRTVSLSPAFTRALHAAIREQAHTAWEEAAYDQAIEALYRDHPSTSHLVASATVRTMGGA